MYTIIEDSSPYYIRFAWEGLEDIIKFISIQPIDINKGTQEESYVHYNFDMKTAGDIIHRLPMKSDLVINYDRVSLFITDPGNKSAIHKDGAETRYSINIPISILDDDCLTAWFSDESLKDARQQNSEYSRIADIDNCPIPIKSMVVKSNECVLFNTDIYHSWDNEKSVNKRIILTLRDIDVANVYFDDVKKTLFGL
jgi:hypothetical protein